MSLRSPIGRVLGLGTAKDGAEHWWSQRVTASALAVLGPWFLISLLCNGSFDYDSVAGWISRPYNAVLLSLFIATLVYHSKLGIQVVIEDYVTSHGTKIASLVLSNFVHVFVGVLGVFAVLRVAFGVIA
jgi:succinate dehydrogenase / fumarate reductase, membrane anchor subunit